VKQERYVGTITKDGEWYVSYIQEFDVMSQGYTPEEAAVMALSSLNDFSITGLDLVYIDESMFILEEDNIKFTDEFINKMRAAKL